MEQEGAHTSLSLEQQQQRSAELAARRRRLLVKATTNRHRLWLGSLADLPDDQLERRFSEWRQELEGFDDFVQKHIIDKSMSPDEEDEDDDDEHHAEGELDDSESETEVEEDDTEDELNDSDCQAEEEEDDTKIELDDTGCKPDMDKDSAKDELDDSELQADKYEDSAKDKLDDSKPQAETDKYSAEYEWPLGAEEQDWEAAGWLQPPHKKKRGRGRRWRKAARRLARKLANTPSRLCRCGRRVH